MEETAGYEGRFSLGLEDIASYRNFFSAEEFEALESGDWSRLRDEWEVKREETSLPEQDALRMAKSLEDCEHVTVTDIGGCTEHGYWLRIRDERVGRDYEIASHCDYWDFISHYTVGGMWPVRSIKSAKHCVSVRWIDDGYELVCDRCEFYDHVCDVRDADNLKRFHEEFQAVLVARYEVPSDAVGFYR